MIKGKLTISRPNYGDGKEKIAIKLKDVDAVLSPIEIEIGYEEFALAITGMSSVECEFEATFLDRIGKQRESMILAFEMPSHFNACRNKDVARERAAEAAPEGWVFEKNFSSQNSFYEEDGKRYARTNAYRWVDKQ